MTQFMKTKIQFEEALDGLGCDSSNYWDWLLIPSDFKAIALYVQFYEQITLAWEKTKKPFVYEEDAVSTLMQYLLKNIPILESDRKRFTPAYIYKIAFNAFYPLVRIKRDIDFYTNWASTYGPVLDVNLRDDDEENLFTEPYYIDRLVDEKTPFDEFNRNEFWKLIESTDSETKQVVERLVNGKKIRKRDADAVANLVEILGIFYNS